MASPCLKQDFISLQGLPTAAGVGGSEVEAHPPTHKEWEGAGQVQVLTPVLTRRPGDPMLTQRLLGNSRLPVSAGRAPSYQAVSMGVGALLNFSWGLSPLTFVWGYVNRKLEREKVKRVLRLLIWFPPVSVFS